MDAEKELYGRCYDEIVPALVPGGILAADSASDREATLRPLLDRAG